MDIGIADLQAGVLFGLGQKPAEGVKIHIARVRFDDDGARIIALQQRLDHPPHRHIKGFTKAAVALGLQEHRDTALWHF